MTALITTLATVRVVKQDLALTFPDVKSSHLSEALARALGFNSHAALRANILESQALDPAIRLIDEGALLKRIRSLGYQIEDADLGLDFLEDDVTILSTTPVSSFEIKYKSQRKCAWRNLMVGAINAGIERKLFSLRDEDNRWPGYVFEDRYASTSFKYDFSIAGLPARARISDAGYGEILFNVAVEPTCEDLIGLPNEGRSRGNAHAAGWLERKKGPWLQSSATMFSCTNTLKPKLAQLEMTPLGFGDRGDVIF